VAVVSALGGIRPSWRPREFVRPPALDVAVAAGLVAGAQAEVWVSGGAGVPEALGALGMTAPLAWRRRLPIAVLAAVLGALVAMAAVGRPLDAAFVMAALILAFASVGAGVPRRRSTAAAVGGLVALGSLVVIEPAPVGDMVFVGIIVGGAWALGAVIRSRGDRATELEERAAGLTRDREERAREAVAEGRARIARELHDVVAHSVSVMVMQAGAVRRLLRGDQEREREALSTVEHTGRQALDELRRMLGLLRRDGADVGLAPQPALAQVGDLVTAARAAGLAVTLRTEGRAVPLPPGVDLSAYRIVQEALTNVLKHAGPARAEVTIRHLERAVELEVVDDGAGGPPDEGPGRHGLLGMRERAAFFGGELQAGPREGGGFAVRARLPRAGSAS
jgi:signal transduction histidine kinase